MRVMLGETNSARVRSFVQQSGWGLLYVHRLPRPYSGEAWGFDNGAYIDWKHGREFDGARFRKALDLAIEVGLPYMAVVPDLVARGRESIDFSMRWLEQLPPSWPWYLAVQDGMKQEDVEPIIPHFAGIFLGGTDRLKEQAEEWCAFAHLHSKPFHFARAGTERKIKQAIRIGADSIDSNFPLWHFSRMRRLEYLLTDWQIMEPNLGLLEVV